MIKYVPVLHAGEQLQIQQIFVIYLRMYVVIIRLLTGWVLQLFDDTWWLIFVTRADLDVTCHIHKFRF